MCFMAIYIFVAFWGDWSQSIAYHRSSQASTVNSQWLEPCANSIGLKSISLDFLHAFTAISPLVMRTLDNSNFSLSGSNYCFPSDHYNSNHVFSVVQVGNKLRQCAAVPNIELRIQFVCAFLSVQFKYSVQPCISIYIPFFNVNISYCAWSEVWMVLALHSFLKDNCLALFNIRVFSITWTFFATGTGSTPSGRLTDNFA